jgi:hypothetical protein
VRISYATTAENIDNALQRMRKYFAGL